MEKDLATYRAQEPDICIKPCEPADTDNLVESTSRVATPLTEAEISKWLAVLQQKHPLKTDFTPPPASTTTDGTGATTTTTYTSPPDDKIAMYRDTHYPEWIRRCRSILADLHIGRDEVAPPVVLRWSMSNKGTRPASQVRIEFEAKGPIELRRLKPKRDDDEDDDGDEAQADAPVAAAPPAGLPSPPQPPEFQKQLQRTQPPRPIAVASPLVSASKIPGFAFSDPSLAKLGLTQQNQLRNYMSSLDVLKGTRGIDLLNAHAIPVFPMHRMLSPHDLIPKKHEPESFYFDWPASRPVKKGALTCDLWRHQADEEVFEFEVVFTKDGEARGVVECTVHAENLTKPEQAKVIVCRTIKPQSLSDLVQAIVKACR